MCVFVCSFFPPERCRSGWSEPGLKASYHNATRVGLFFVYFVQCCCTCSSNAKCMSSRRWGATPVAFLISLFLLYVGRVTGKWCSVPKGENFGMSGKIQRATFLCSTPKTPTSAAIATDDLWRFAIIPGCKKGSPTGVCVRYDPRAFRLFVIAAGACVYCVRSLRVTTQSRLDSLVVLSSGIVGRSERVGLRSAAPSACTNSHVLSIFSLPVFFSSFDECVGLVDAFVGFVFVCLSFLSCFVFALVLLSFPRCLVWSFLLLCVYLASTLLTRLTNDDTPDLFL